MEVTIPFDPRPSQIDVYRALKRFNVLICHRRWGKTVLCINKLISAALKNKRERPRYAYIAPLYRQAKQTSWDYLKHYTSVIPGTKVNEAELRVDLPNGARITLYGAENYDALRGIYLDGVVLDEFAQMPLKAWTEVIRPALSDRLGWAIFIGTPKGHNAFFDLYQQAQADPEWYAGMFKASETKIIPASELDAARRNMTPDEYDQEYECSFEAAIQGAYYADEMRLAKEKRVTSVEYQPDMLVHTAWDLGYDDATSIIFFQIVGREIHIIDYEEHNGESLMFYTSLLEQKGYRYGTHYLPHDAAAKELGTGKSIEEQMWDLGVKRTEIVPMLKVDPGIQAVRRIFTRLWFDKDKCKHLVECLTQYHKELDEERSAPGRPFYRSKPEHDWSSHAADALRYLAVSFNDPPSVDLPVYQDYSGGRLTA